VSDLGVGDVEVPWLDVTPADATTAATLVATRPDDSTIPIATGAPGAVDGKRRFTAAEAITYNQPGWWVLTWTVTGTGASSETQRKLVVASPVAGGPTWTPGRSRVANYVPARTQVHGQSGVVLTFDSTTRPTGIQVDRLIADGVSWVVSRCGTIHSSLTDLASAVAAVYAAAMVEQGFPEREAVTRENAIDTAAQLWRQARQMLDDLSAANTAATGTSPTDPNSALLPRFSFPDPVPWGDKTFL